MTADDDSSPRIEKLAPQHVTASFDCGIPVLNRFLDKFALLNQRQGGAQTYVGIRDDKVVGYYALAVGHVAHDEAAGRLKHGLARHPVSVMLLARLAVDRAWWGQGMAAGLLKDALLRTLQAADIAGIRAVVVHAKDDNAARFYRHFGFAPSPSDERHLYLLIKDIRAIVKY